LTLGLNPAPQWAFSQKTCFLVSTYFQDTSSSVSAHSPLIFQLFVFYFFYVMASFSFQLSNTF
jgi:hypothetical protein